jgi:hypothetical protein
LALAVLATTEMSLADQERDAARAYYAAEAGALRAYHYLTQIAPDGTADGSWRTPGLTEPLAPGEEYTMAVADGAGPTARDTGAPCPPRSPRPATTGRGPFT